MLNGCWLVNKGNKTRMNACVCQSLSHTQAQVHSHAETHTQKHSLRHTLTLTLIHKSTITHKTTHKNITHIHICLYNRSHGHSHRLTPTHTQHKHILTHTFTHIHSPANKPQQRDRYTNTYSLSHENTNLITYSQALKHLLIYSPTLANSHTLQLTPTQTRA